MDDKQIDGVAELLGSSDIREGIEKKDFKLLVEHLRSKEPVYPLIRSFLADLFDPKKPIRIYAEIVLKRGNKSKLIRDLELYAAVQDWKTVNKKKGMPDDEWEKIAKIFKSGGISGARAAHMRAQLAYEIYDQINALED